ncbi:MAG TPA: DUF3515 family protein [Mycobacteriales bacterium]|jgi:hypothetical protein|nr:DUF3515 family protein [Mycobacteriales bacterium]
MRVAAVLLCGAAAVAFPACSHPAKPVAVDAVPTAAAERCARFAAKLPRSLGDGLSRRPTRPADPHVAAYGDPPIVVRCGAPASTVYQPGDQLFTVNGIGWFPEERADAVVWSLPRAFVNVSVTIPRHWSGDRLAPLTDAVRAMS